MDEVEVGLEKGHAASLAGERTSFTVRVQGCGFSVDWNNRYLKARQWAGMFEGESLVRDEYCRAIWATRESE